MAIREETSGRTVVCDGCGREDAGPGEELWTDAYFEGDKKLILCAACALQRLDNGKVRHVSELHG